MGELDVSELSGKAFWCFRIFLEDIEFYSGTRIEFRREVSTDREEPVIVSKVSERLLKEVIERIESTIEAKYHQDTSPNALCSWLSVPFHPESATLRDSLLSLFNMSLRFGMADVIAIDRLMKQIEKNSDSGVRPYISCLPIKPAFLRRFGDCSETISALKATEDTRWHLERYIERICNAVSASRREDAFTVVVAAVLHLLAFVFQYLIGYVDRGGSKTFSSSSFDFRATFVSLVLFQGAYVWIKFRQAAPVPSRKRKASDAVLKGTIYRRAYKDKAGNVTHCRYEPRFPLQKDEVDEGERINRLPLGGYATHVEAEIVLQIVRSYYGPYGEGGGWVELESSQFKFLIPPMSEKDAGKKKRTWVPCKAMELVTQTYKDFQETQLRMGSETGHGHDAGSSDPSPSALPVTCSSPTTIATEPIIVTDAPLCPSSSSLPPCNGTVGGSCDTLPDCDYLIPELRGLGLPNLPPQQSSLIPYEMHFQGFSQILEDSSSPRHGAVTHGNEHGEEPQLSPSLNFEQGRCPVDLVPEEIDTRGPGLVLEQSDSVLQQLVDSQKKQMKNYASQFVEWDCQLTLYQMQNSQLQQEIQRLRHEKELSEREKKRLRQENERLKSNLEQVAKIISCTGIEKS